MSQTSRILNKADKNKVEKYWPVFEELHKREAHKTAKFVCTFKPDIYYDVFLDYYIKAVQTYNPDKQIFPAWLQHQTRFIFWEYLRRTNKLDTPVDFTDHDIPIDDTPKTIELMRAAIQTLTAEERHVVAVFMRNKCKYNPTLKELTNGKTSNKNKRNKALVDSVLAKIKRYVLEADS